MYQIRTTPGIATWIVSWVVLAGLSLAVAVSGEAPVGMATTEQPASGRPPDSTVEQGVPAAAHLATQITQAEDAPPPASADPKRRTARRGPQQRPSGVRVSVPEGAARVEDGDTVEITWPSGDREMVRLLGIDTPETRGSAIPFDQPFGREASAFAKGAFAVASRIELLRAATGDPYGRTLGYIYLDEHNYSELVLRAGLAVETISHHGDNGFPEEAGKILEAARAAPPVPFENPDTYRKRMREYNEGRREASRLR